MMCRSCRVVVVLSLCIVGLVCAKDQDNGHKSRVIHEDLSKSEHDIHGQHNPQYDRDAFLGEDAQRFTALTPEEGLTQLGNIVDKVDTNHDSLVSPDELRAWLKKVNQRMMSGDITQTWNQYGLKKDGLLTWERYKQHAMGPEGEYEDEDETVRNESLARDERRWKLADTNGDLSLSVDEAVAFFHPESFPRMHDAVAENTIDEMDKNKDGFVDVEEFIQDLHTPSADEVEPEWVKDERKEFLENRDKNKDGKLDRDEVKAWIFPEDYDHVESEVKHLLSECDIDKDGFLSKKEILDKYDLFVGSPVTNFGEVLSNHDEL